jgi:hypothetical protein
MSEPVELVGPKGTKTHYARVMYNYQAAEDYGEHRHAQTVMKELADSRGFRITHASAHPQAGGWYFELESDKLILMPELPPYLYGRIGGKMRYR